MPLDFPKRSEHNLECENDEDEGTLEYENDSVSMALQFCHLTFSSQTKIKVNRSLRRKVMIVKILFRMKKIYLSLTLQLCHLTFSREVKILLKGFCSPRTSKA